MMELATSDVIFIPEGFATWLHETNTTAPEKGCFSIQISTILTRKGKRNVAFLPSTTLGKVKNMPSGFKPQNFPDSFYSYPQHGGGALAP